MLVTISRWLVTFGVDCEKAFGPRWAEGRRESMVEVEALGGRESRRERAGSV